MPFPDFFKQFGIFSAYEFLTAEFCERLGTEMRFATASIGTVWHAEMGRRVMEDVKKRKECAGLSSEFEICIREKLLELMPRMAEHFGVELKDVQPLKFTRYDEGDYYYMHVDVLPDREDAPAEVSDRKVAIIIFVNQEGENLDEGDYVGGNLTFYELIDDDQWRNVGLPLESEAGLLIAFRPDLLHGVTTITKGCRFAITTWFV